MYHILIVDEEEHLLWALERNLFPARDDVEVFTAGSGEEALETLEKRTVDLLISDIKMPGAIDGFELILQAKERAPDARVMIITAAGSHQIEDVADQIGISHYIEKPFTVEELREAAKSIMEESGGFQGVLSDLELTDIIQMLCLAKRSAILHLKHRDARGEIVFEGGEVIDASYGEIRGEEAVYSMLRLREGDIFMQSDVEPRQRVIERGWQDLLLEGVRRADEARLSASLSEPVSESSVEDDAEDAEDDGDNGNEGEQEEVVKGFDQAPPTTEFEYDASEFEPPLKASSQTEDAMFFSEAELEEISKASEAAIEEKAPARSRVDFSDLDSDQPAAPKDQAAEARALRGSPFAAAELEEGSDGLFEMESPSKGAETNSSSPFAAVDGDVTRGSPEMDGPLHSGLGFRDLQSRADEETPREEAKPRRRRQGTSPGIGAVTSETTVESGELDLFAAPALSGAGRQSDDAPWSEESQQLLDEFQEDCPGLVLTGLVAFDGDRARSRWVPLRTVREVREVELTQSLADVYERATRCVSSLNQGDGARELQLTLDEHYLLMRALEDRSLLHIALVKRRISLGIALVLMRQMEKALNDMHPMQD